MSVPFSGWLGPDNMSDADVDWLMGRQSWHLIGQEGLLHHCVVVAAGRANFPAWGKKK